MKVFLIQGKSNSGKTTLINKILDYLKENPSFKTLKERRDKVNDKDFNFMGIYCIEEKRYIINTWSDQKGIIQDFIDYYSENREQGYDIVITAIRPYDVNPILHSEIKKAYEEDFSEAEIIIDLDKAPQNWEYHLNEFKKYI